jgi:hypothetical protein
MNECEKLAQAQKKTPNCFHVYVKSKKKKKRIFFYDTIICSKFLSRPFLKEEKKRHASKRIYMKKSKEKKSRMSGTSFFLSISF